MPQNCVPPATQWLGSASLPPWLGAALYEFCGPFFSRYAPPCPPPSPPWTAVAANRAGGRVSIDRQPLGELNSRPGFLSLPLTPRFSPPQLSPNTRYGSAVAVGPTVRATRPITSPAPAALATRWIGLAAPLRGALVRTGTRGRPGHTLALRQTLTLGGQTLNRALLSTGVSCADIHRMSRRANRIWQEDGRVAHICISRTIDLRLATHVVGRHYFPGRSHPPDPFIILPIALVVRPQQCPRHPF